jgi:hypothetical protein
VERRPPNTEDHPAVVGVLVAQDVDARELPLIEIELLRDDLLVGRSFPAGRRITVEASG